MNDAERKILREQKLEDEISRLNKPFIEILHYLNDLATRFRTVDDILNDPKKVKSIKKSEGDHIADDFSIVLTGTKHMHFMLSQLLKLTDDHPAWIRDKQLSEIFAQEDALKEQRDKKCQPTKR